MTSMPSYTFGQTLWLVILRIMISWHFIYEGLVKILSPGWSAYSYLMDAQGFLAAFFHDLASNPVLLRIIEHITVIGLILVGICLLAGVFARFASIAGICFLGMYYLSHPPIIGAEYIMPAEGTYLWIDKNIIEISALMVLIYFPTSHIVGIDRFIYPLSTRLCEE